MVRLCSCGVKLVGISNIEYLKYLHFNTGMSKGIKSYQANTKINISSFIKFHNYYIFDFIGHYHF